MINPKWYLRCDIVAKRAIDLMQIPEVWRNTTGMSEQSDVELARYNEWSGNPEVFYTVAAAKAAGIDIESINFVLEDALPTVQNWVRSMREPILAMSDQVTYPDRWKTYDVVQQNDIAMFRQALRDVTVQDPLNVVWPAIPPELDYLRSLDIGSIERPSQSFINMLTHPGPVKTREQLQQDQWRRIHAERERRKAGGLKLSINGKEYWFWTDDPTRNQYALLDSRVRRANLPLDYTIDLWKTMSGEFVTFRVQTLNDVIDAGIISEGKLFRIAENHRRAMLAAKDPTTYDYTTGWPLTFEEAKAAQLI